MGDPERHVRKLEFSRLFKTFPSGTAEITNGMITDRFDLEEVVIPNSVKRIAYEAFKWCFKLKVVRFGTGLESIGNEAFYDCDKLKSIHIPGNLKTVGNGAFWGCSSLTAVQFPDTTTEIGLDVFERCSSLLEFKVPLGVKKLPRKMFAECEKLQSIKLHENTEEIGNMAFSLCAALKPFFMPDSVKWIGKEAFDNCKSLTELSLSKNLTEIGEYAFHGCSIEELVIPENCELGFGSFTNNRIKRIAIPLNYQCIDGYRDELYRISREGDEIPFTFAQIFGTQVGTPNPIEKVKFYGPVANREQTMKMLLQWHDFKNVTFIFDNFEIMDLLRNAIAARIDSGQAEGFFEGAVLRMNKYSSFDDVRQNAFSGGGDAEYINQVFEAMSLDAIDGGIFDGKTMEYQHRSKDIMLPKVKQMPLQNITVPTMIDRAEAVEGTPKLSGSKVFPRPEPVDAPPTKRQAFGTK